MTPTAVAATTTPAPWAVLLPPGWVRLPTEAAAGRRAITALLDKRLRRLPRDTVAAARRAVERHLRAVLSEARAAGASDVFAQFDLIRGYPVDAGLTVMTLPTGGDEVEILQALGGAGGEVVESASTACGDLPALRRRRTFLRDLGGPEPVRCVGVDWVVALPEGDLLVLAFATATLQVADELVALFDTVAQSLTVAPAPP